MKFKNVNEKRRFIDSLEKMDNQSIREIIDIIDLLASDKNIDVRRILAKQMVIFDCDEVEDILYGMLDDKNRMVRLEAVDSLSVGRHVVALKIRSMCSKMDITLSTAGIDTGILRFNEIRAFCKKNGIFCPEKLYAKRVTEVYAYDYIVCLNIMQNQDMYSKIRTVHYKDIDIQSDEQVQLICKDIQKQLISLKI